MFAPGDVFNEFEALSKLLQQADQQVWGNCRQQGTSTLSSIACGSMHMQFAPNSAPISPVPP